MARRIVSFALSVLLVVALVDLQPASSHTGHTTTSVFTLRSRPDLPFEGYARGRMGIILADYDDLFAFIAYRNLVGERFSPAEIKVAQRLWQTELNERGKQMQEYEPPALNRNWRVRWFARRATMEGAALSQEKKENILFDWLEIRIKGEYEYFPNCLDDGFRTALTTLANRSKTFGATSSLTKSWVRAQDRVFENCSTRDQPAIPEPLEAGTDHLLRADRAYQIASAYFYAARYEEAGKLFDSIASDASSPWHGIAPYLAARAEIRQATVFRESEKLQDAEKRLSLILEDPTRTEWHEPARKLLRFVRIRTHPDDVFSELAGKLSKTDGLIGKEQDLTDYFYLLDRYRGELAKTKTPSMSPPREDMTQWLISWGSYTLPAFPGADAKWRQANSLAWLLCTLQKAGKDDPGLSSLLQAAAQVSKGSPAYFTARFERARLLTEQGRGDEARRELDTLLTDQTKRPPLSTVNLLRSLRMKNATSLEDFLKYAVRKPAALVYTDEFTLQWPADDRDPRDAYLRSALAQPHFDIDAGIVLNAYLPVSLLTKAAQESALPADLRKQIALVAFCRAALLKDHEAGARVARELLGLAPEMNEELSAYVSATSERAREFAAVFLILRYPGIMPVLNTGDARPDPLSKIDTFRDNWWCNLKPPDGTRESEAYFEGWWEHPASHLHPVYTSGRIQPPTFLSTAERTLARSEWDSLSKTEPGVAWLGNTALSWAKAHQ